MGQIAFDNALSFAAKGSLKRHFFLAIMPPPEVQQAFKDVCRNAPHSWRCNRPEDFHISIAFPGQLDELQLQKLKDVMKDFSIRPFEITYHGVSVLRAPHRPPNREQLPHILQAKLTSNSFERLQKLLTDICDRLHKAGFHTGHPQRIIHMTLAKTYGSNLEEARDYAAANNNVPRVYWKCNRISLCEKLPKTDPHHPANTGKPVTRFPTVATFNFA